MGACAETVQLKPMVEMASLPQVSAPKSDSHRDSLNSQLDAQKRVVDR